VGARSGVGEARLESSGARGESGAGRSRGGDRRGHRQSGRRVPRVAAAHAQRIEPQPERDPPSLLAPSTLEAFERGLPARSRGCGALMTELLRALATFAEPPTDTLRTLCALLDVERTPK